MVGDRQTKDMQPPADLLGEKIVTIRLHSLGYAVDGGEIAADAKANPPPGFIADTLAQAKAILLAKETWKSVRCASDPPLFNCKVETTQSRRGYYPEPGDKEVWCIGLDYVECGCKMAASDFRATRRICAGILVEHLTQCTDASRNAVLERYLNPAAARRPPVRERVALLCALIRAGMLSQDVLDQFQVQLVKEIVADVEDIRGEEPQAGDDRRLLHDAELEHEVQTALERMMRDGVSNARKESQQALKRLRGDLA